MPRNKPTTSWNTRIKPTTGWETPRFVSANALSNMLNILLCDISWEQLGDSDPDSTQTNVITTDWT